MREAAPGASAALAQAPERFLVDAPAGADRHELDEVTRGIP